MHGGRLGHLHQVSEQAETCKPNLTRLCFSMTAMWHTKSCGFLSVVIRIWIVCRSATINWGSVYYAANLLLAQSNQLSTFQIQMTTLLNQWMCNTQVWNWLHSIVFPAKISTHSTEMLQNRGISVIQSVWQSENDYTSAHSSNKNTSSTNSRRAWTSWGRLTRDESGLITTLPLGPLPMQLSLQLLSPHYLSPGEIPGLGSIPVGRSSRLIQSATSMLWIFIFCPQH